MSKPDENKIEFHAVVAIDRDEIKMSKRDVIAWRRDALASDLGRLVAKTKGWKMAPEGPMCYSYLDLYVFTKLELWDYREAIIKEKLIEMASRETESDIKDRLLMLSERV